MKFETHYSDETHEKYDKSFISWKNIAFDGKWYVQDSNVKLLIGRQVISETNTIKTGEICCPKFFLNDVDIPFANFSNIEILLDNDMILTKEQLLFERGNLKVDKPREIIIQTPKGAFNCLRYDHGQIGLEFSHESEHLNMKIIKKYRQKMNKLKYPEINDYYTS